MMKAVSQLIRDDGQQSQILWSYGLIRDCLIARGLGRRTSVQQWLRLHAVVNNMNQNLIGINHSYKHPAS